MKMKLGIPAIAAAVVVSLSIFGCTSAKQEAQAPAPTAQTQPAAPMMAAAPGAADSGFSGKVVETMNSGGYTYVCLERGGKKTWYAIPQTAVMVGQKLALQPGMEMKNFKSKTLNRTFESVIFSGGIR